MYNTLIRNKAMTVNHEIKSQLAKLLATEDLVVENKHVETACFNVHTRVLTLPTWERATSIVHDLLVGHEVGHALFTPDSDWFKERKIPPQFVNVVEDARIEKLMKRKYPGLAKTFYKGYSELSEEDFFKIEDEDISTFNLADKANLYFKIGNFIDLEFDAEESVLIKRIADSETFEEVLDIAEDLYAFCKKKQEEESKVKFDNHEQTSGQSQQDDQGDQQLDLPQGGMDSEPESEDENQTESSSQQTETEGFDDEEPVQQPDHSPGETFDPDVKTMSSLEEGLRNLATNYGPENVYAELPALDLKKVIVSNEEIHQRCADEWMGTHPSAFEEVDPEFKEFKRNAQKEVNYLVKEFECRKSASAYARATTARTGVLDCTKLHTYKYNEDLFRKVTTFSNGKNHGLVFVLDWSGSMCDVMTDTVKQLFNLIWFCKKVSIPFDVYAFTCDYPRMDANGHMNLSYEKKHGLVQVREYFSMMNILTSSTKGKVLEEQMLNIYRLAKFFSGPYRCLYNCPVGMSLSGTPLNEALISLHQIIPQFKNTHRVEKVQCVILSDGEAPPLKYHKLFDNSRFDEPYIGVNSLNHNSFIRDRKTGNTYSLDVDWYEHVNIMLRILRDRMPSVNFVGIRVLAPRDASGFMRMYFKTENDYQKIHKYWRKNKSFSIMNSGYHRYFGISASAMSQDSEFEVKDDATKSQIKSAFTKSLRNKKMNKKVLSEFIELIA